MSAGSAVAAAATFIWVGMVVAISFIEAPLKFRAPGMTLQIGLGLGQLVFRALNRAELILAAVIVVACLAGPAPVSVGVTVVAVFAAMAVQLLVLRPRMHQRAEQVRAGLDATRSRRHYTYVGFETVKLIALAATGILLLSS